MTNYHRHLTKRIAFDRTIGKAFERFRNRIIAAVLAMRWAGWLRDRDECRFHHASNTAKFRSRPRLSSALFRALAARSALAARHIGKAQTRLELSQRGRDDGRG